MKAHLRLLLLTMLASCGGSLQDSNTATTDCQNVVLQSCDAVPGGPSNPGPVLVAAAGSRCDPATRASTSAACTALVTALSAEVFALEELASVYDVCVTGGGTGATSDATCLCAVNARYQRDFAAAGQPFVRDPDPSAPSTHNALAPYGTTSSIVARVCGATASDAGTD